MQYVAIDYHKKYSVMSAINEQGQRTGESRINGNTQAGFAQFFKSLGEPCKVVMEACWNWGALHDQLETIAEVQEMILANPYKTRIIAEAQIKTDVLDARALAKLLRGDLIAQVWIPSHWARERKNVLRQRTFMVRLRTMLRNRVHILVARQVAIDLPQVSDLFGRKGILALKALKLPEPDATLLIQDLEVLELLQKQIKALEKLIEQHNESSEETQLLESIPGMGKILAACVATEIDDITRFRCSKKLWAYAGLVPTTHSSGGKTYNGNLLPMCNKWLRWAFVEAAWVAVGCSGYFGAIYQNYRRQGKEANTAIIVVARRMAEIAYKLLKERRPYQERCFNQNHFPDRSQTGLVAT